MKRMRNRNFKNYISTIGTVALITPIVAVSAVACSSQKSNSAKTSITIETQPQNEVAVVGQTTNMPTFSVSAQINNPDASLTYQWYQNTTASTTNAIKIPEATQPNYTVPKSDTIKFGKTYFYVVIKGFLNGSELTATTSNLASLSVNLLPTISINTQPQNQIAIVNKTDNLPTFSVKATSSYDKEVLNYQWYSNTTNSNQKGTKIDGATADSYTVPQTDVANIGTKYFYVEVSGSINGVSLLTAVSNPASLTVYQQPTINISAQPQNQTITSGTAVTLSAQATIENNINDSKLSYQWYSAQNTSGDNPQLIEGATSNTYTISGKQTEVDQDTKLYYFVKISNQYAEPVQSNVATITIGFTQIQANNQLLNYLANPVNQESVLESYFKNSSANITNLFGTIYSYWIKNQPTMSFVSLDYLTKTTSNGLPFSTWQLKAKVTTAGGFVTWAGSGWGTEETPIPVGAIITIQLPFSLAGTQIFTNSANVSITLSQNITITNGSTSISYTQSPASGQDNANFGQFTFQISNGSSIIMSTNYQYPSFPTINNTNSSLPTYTIIS